MQTIIKKIRLIYTPYLIIGISIIIFYSFLNWALIIKTNYFQIDEGIINIWIPSFLPIIPFLIWLPPKIKLLNLKTKKGGLPISYFFIAVFTISIPTVLAQEYLCIASGAMTNMDNIEQINPKDPTKFYSLKNYYIDTANIGIYTSSKETVSGRFHENKYLEIEIFAVLPILVHEKDTLNRTCFAWYGLYDSDQIRLAESDYEKNIRYKRMLRLLKYNIKYNNLTHFIYLNREINSFKGSGFKNAIKYCPKYKSINSEIFTGINEPFEQRNGNKLLWVFGSFGIGCCIFLIMVLWADFDKKELQKYEISKLNGKTK